MRHHIIGLVFQVGTRPIYDRQLNSYLINRDGYDAALIRYERLAPLYKKCTRLEYIRNALSICWEQYTLPAFEPNHSVVKQGPAEHLFIIFLNSVLTQTGEYELLEPIQTLHFFQDYYMVYYYPDIAIRDIKSGLMIDIEIDEPYIAKTGVPIHCNGLSNSGKTDYERNKALSSDNWLIFHFSEEQIVRFPVICWTYVKAICSGLLNHTELEEPCLSGFTQKRWDYHDAKTLAESNYRLSYLPKNTWAPIRVPERTRIITSNQHDSDNLPF